MSLWTDLTRMWLTRSRQPFRFEAEYDQPLPDIDCENLGLYVHIPFCRTLCHFCPYCKVPYQESLATRYMEALIREVHLLGSQFQERKVVSSLYFGGGTPSLLVKELPRLVSALEQYFEIREGLAIELHPEDVQIDILEQLRDLGVRKISIGIQSFQGKFQKLLGRKFEDTESMRKALAAVPFDTVSMDFIFALPEQTVDDLRADLTQACELGANHVAFYPFIDFSFTGSPFEAGHKREKQALLDGLTSYCEAQNYQRKSIWTFALSPEADYSSMCRDNYLGLGCSAATLLPGQFKINTFSIEAYCQRLAEGKLPTSLTLRFSRRQRMLYYLFWTAYGMDIREADFERFFGTPLRRVYGFEFWLARCLGYLARKPYGYRLSRRGAFAFHYYENFYTLSYIDRMWGLLRHEAFPESLEF